MCWSQLDEVTRRRIAQERADKHNRLLKYTEVFNDTLQEMKGLNSYLSQRNARIQVIVPPFSREYLEFLNDDLKETFYLWLQKVGLMHNIVDFNVSNEMLEDDACFIDPDHLSDMGAMLFTEKIKGMI